MSRCPRCGDPLLRSYVKIPTSSIRSMVTPADPAVPARPTYYRAVGCSRCSFEGREDQDGVVTEKNSD